MDRQPCNEGSTWTEGFARREALDLCNESNGQRAIKEGGEQRDPAMRKRDGGTLQGGKYCTRGSGNGPPMRAFFDRRIHMYIFVKRKPELNEPEICASSGWSVCASTTHSPNRQCLIPVENCECIFLVRSPKDETLVKCNTPPSVGCK